MQNAIYAGSFDPWTFGHWFVLRSAMNVFDHVTILISKNPSKRDSVSISDRIALIESFLDPTKELGLLGFSIASLKNQRNLNPWNCSVEVNETLVVNWAKEKNIKHLIRGLRSTSDFESEFNLYFSNLALCPSIETWTVLCPPELLHCSSTFVKTVTSNGFHSHVGTSFTIQSYLNRVPRSIGILLDCMEMENQQGIWLHRISQSTFIDVLQVIYNLLGTAFVTHNEFQEKDLEPFFKSSSLRDTLCQILAYTRISQGRLIETLKAQLNLTQTHKSVINRFLDIEI